MATVNTLNIGNVTLPGSGYPPIGAMSIPVTDGLTGAFLLGSGSNVGATNYAENGGTVTFVGSPDWQNGYVEVDRLNYIQTSIPETAAMTIIAIAKRKVSGNNTPIVGNFIDVTNVGVALYVASGTDNPIANADRAAGGGTVTVNGNWDAWSLVSLVVPSTGAMTITDHTNGLTANSAATDARVITGGGDIRIGSFYSVSFPGASQIAAVAVYNKALSPIELTAMEAWASDVGSHYGLTV